MAGEGRLRRHPGRWWRGWGPVLYLLGTVTGQSAAHAVDFGGTGDRLFHTEQRRAAAAATLAVAEDRVTAARRVWTERARARLRVEERYLEASLDLAARRRALAVAFAGLGTGGGREARVRLMLTGLASAAEAAAARVERLAAARPVLARQLRAAAAVPAFRAVRRSTAERVAASAARQWRHALRAYASAAAALPPSALPRARQSIALLAADSATLAGAPSARHWPPERADDHKRAIPPDQRLDRRLLRLANSDRSARSRLRGATPSAYGTGPVLPIAGRLAAGGSPGLGILTGVSQVVSAPVSGQVMFAQSFRGVGPLLIIDRGGGYHVVLSGLTRLDVRRGASVVAGQSVGEIVAREDGPARLQFELRYRGLPIDPAPWLAAYQDKVSS